MVLGSYSARGKEKTEKHQEVDAQIAPDTRPDDPATACIDFLGRRFALPAFEVSAAPAAAGGGAA